LGYRIIFKKQQQQRLCFKSRKEKIDKDGNGLELHLAIFDHECKQTHRFDGQHSLKVNKKKGK